MIAIRKEIPALNSGDFRWLDCHNSKVFSYYRHSDQEQILCIHNLSPEPQQFNIQLSNEKEGMIDQLSEQKFAVQGKLMEIELEPYQYLWLF